MVFSNFDHTLLFGLTVEKTWRGEGIILFLHIRDRLFYSSGLVPPDMFANGADAEQVFNGLSAFHTILASSLSDQRFSRKEEH